MGRRPRRQFGDDEIPYSCSRCEEPVYDLRRPDGRIVVMHLATEVEHVCGPVAFIRAPEIPQEPLQPVYSVPPPRSTFDRYLARHYNQVGNEVWNDVQAASARPSWTTARGVGASVRSNTGSKAWTTHGDANEEEAAALQRVFGRYLSEARQGGFARNEHVRRALEDCGDYPTVESLTRLQVAIRAARAGVT